jgi:hypothetical protein
LVDLNWTTESELNNDYFIVEKSADLETIEEVVNVDGNGTTTLLSDYGALDENPYTGLSYYRLRQVDFDGTANYSAWEPINNAGIGEILIVPNPADAFVTVQLCESYHGISIKIYDLLGNLIFVQDYAEYQSIFNTSISTVAEGMYIMAVEYEGIRNSQPFIVMH